MSVYSSKPGEDIDSCLHHWSNTHPQKLAIADSQARLTWQTLDSKLNQVANALIGSGLEPNQRLAILGRNSVDYALLFLGGLRAGLCIVPLSTIGIVRQSGEHD
jgi:acyl-CoA synthetase (AMP-forming)/AMP-acid ligase II